MGYMFDKYKKIANRFDVALTGKSLFLAAASQDKRPLDAAQYILQKPCLKATGLDLKAKAV
jgi:glutamate dehydrogenase/leucine dehydrogenase